MENGHWEWRGNEGVEEGGMKAMKSATPVWTLKRLIFKEGTLSN
jgi:hypothetical protein